MSSNSQSPKPVQEFRLGPIKAAVWENDTDYGVRYGVTFSRLYKDAKKNWKGSASFNRDDLPLVQKVADKAHDWIFAQAHGNGSTDE